MESLALEALSGARVLLWHKRLFTAAPGVELQDGVRAQWLLPDALGDVFQRPELIHARNVHVSVQVWRAMPVVFDGAGQCTSSTQDSADRN